MVRKMVDKRLVERIKLNVGLYSTAIDNIIYDTERELKRLKGSIADIALAILSVSDEEKMRAGLRALSVLCSSLKRIEDAIEVIRRENGELYVSVAYAK